MAGSHPAPLRVGEVFHDTRRVFFQHGWILLLLSVALVYTSTAGSAWLRFHPPIHGKGALIGFGNWFIDWIATAGPQSLFIAMACWTVGQVLEERTPTTADILGQGLRFALPVLAIQTLYLLGVMAAGLLLVVPGIILGLMWMVAPTALVVERSGVVDAFNRSRAVTKGHRWALLGLVIAYMVVVVSIEWTIFRITTPGLTFTAAATAPQNAYGVVPAMTVLTSLLSTTAIAAIYMQLRRGHRGSADATAEVFT